MENFCREPYVVRETKDFVKKKEKHEAKMEKVTDEIFEKFKRGEKLSTDDLMFIQKMEKK